MRLRVFLSVFVLIMLSAFVSLADIVPFGSIYYVYPQNESAPATLTLSVQGESFAPDTLEPATSPLSGAVFGVYAKGPDGTFVPYPDPEDPMRPWELKVGARPLSVAMPRNVDLYIRQNAAPEGFIPGREAQAYTLVTFPAKMVFINHQAHMQGIRVALTGEDKGETSPLPGISFTLSGINGDFEMTTDENGIATRMEITAGENVLKQNAAPDHYSVDMPEIPVSIKEFRPTVLAANNSRHGVLSLRVLGEDIDGAKRKETVPLERQYEVFDAGGGSKGVLSNGSSMSLVADMDGCAYTLRAVNTPIDGFAADPEVYSVTLHSGESLDFEVKVRSNKGFFEFSNVSEEDGRPVAGGRFTLYDQFGNEVLTFEADAKGKYTPPLPLAPGTYALRMVYAPEGRMYADAPVPIAIEPYLLSEAHPITLVTYKSPGLPKALLEPFVTTDPYALPSLFDREAEFDFTLRLLDGNPPLPCSDLLFNFQLPAEAGLRVVEQRPNGATVTIERRVQSSRLEEMFALDVSGRVQFTFTYPVSASESREVPVDAPFKTTVATFANSTRTEPYAILGRVTDQSGKAVSGIQVSLEDASGMLLYDDMRTDPYGAYAFSQRPTGSVLRFQTPEGFGVHMDGDDAQIRPLQVYEGNVTVQGVMEGYPITLAYGQSDPVVPDANGHFTIVGVFEQGDELITHTPEGILATVETVNQQPVVSLFPAAVVSGKALERGASGVSDVEITLRGEKADASTRTDSDGGYTFTGLFPGEYTMTIAKPEGFLLDSSDTMALTISAGEEKENVDIALVRPATVECIAMDNGTPVKGIEITLVQGSQTATTDADGKLSFTNLQVGTYDLGYKLPKNVLLPHPVNQITVNTPGEDIFLAVNAVRPAKLAGRVWKDQEDDGDYAGNEPGLPNVNVVLLTEIGETVTATTTGRNGEFSFEGLVPANYRISVQLPDNMIFARQARTAPGVLIQGVDAFSGTSELYSLTSGQSLEYLQCGGTAAGTVSGVAFHDLNANGVLDQGEPLLPGAGITLTSGDEAVQWTQTDAQGAYRFSGLRLGKYRIKVSLPEDCVFTSQHSNILGAVVASSMPTVDSHEAELAVNLSVGGVMTATVNAGALRKATIRARVWLDENVDGQDLGEKGRGGIALELYRISDAGVSFVASAKTDDDGRAVFADLRPGTFKLKYSLPSSDWGYLSGVEREEGGWGEGKAIAFVAGENEIEVGAGIAKRGEISGLVFVDPDYDGIRAEGAEGLSTDVTLLRADGTEDTKIQSDSSGAYHFRGILPGYYSLRFEIPPGYAFTANRDDAPSFNSDAPEAQGSVGETAQVFLPSGETLLLDAGVYLGASISGSVWQDIRGNGLYAGGNPPFADCAITLVKDAKPYAETTTARDGTYSFHMLPPGDYSVRVALPSGMHFSPPNYEAGRASTIIPTEGNVGTTSVFSMAMGENKVEIDAGAIFTGTVGGKVTKKGTEEGLPGIGVTLMKDGAVIAEIETDQEGKYRFTDVPGGNMELHFEQPFDWLFEPDVTGVVAVNVPQQRSAPDVDIKLLPQTVIEGFIWVDSNFNGEVDESEEPMALAMVTLRKHEKEDEPLEEGIIESFTGTQEDGKFRFDKLQPGFYSIGIVPPEGAIMYSGKESTMLKLEMGENIEFTASAYYASYIMGNIWNDTNGDSQVGRDEEPVIDVPVTLLDEQGNVLKETVTDADGNYLFNELPPGTCQILVTLPDGYVFSDPVEGGSIITHATENVGTGELIVIEMGSGLMDMNVGCMWPARIGDTVWIDENGNGLQDSVEPPAPDIAVSLWRVESSGQLVLTDETKSDAYGRYRFEKVHPGRYQVSFAIGNDFVPTRTVEGLGLINSKLPWVARSIVYTATFEAPSGADILWIDAGILPKSAIEALGWSIGDGGTIIGP